MTRLRGIWTAVVVSLLLLPAGCARGGSSSVSADQAGDPSAGPTGEAPVVRVQHIGGFVSPELIATRLPMISVYDDGRVITEGPQILIYPGPALPNLQVQRIDPAAVGTLVDRAVAAGVRAKSDLGRPEVADAPTTRFTVVTDAGRQVLDVVALNEAAAAPGTLTADQQAARKELVTFVEQLRDLPALLGADKVGKTEPYVPTAIAAVAAPWRPVDDPNVSAPPVRPWPGPALPGQPLGQADGAHCVVVTAAAASEVLAAAREANTLTPWSSGDSRWTVTFRPLLPEEDGCDALKDNA